MGDKRARLDDIRAEITKNNVCRELAENATQLVFGGGNPDADVVFVGEAPGKNEDKQGKPFVGAAGKFLDEMLASIDLGREDVYITNIVKYRPPNNRDPLPEEKKAFLPYLQTQLEVIQPKVLVTLGRHSTNCFLPDLRISKSHGRAKRISLQLKDRRSEMGDRGEEVKSSIPNPQSSIYKVVLLPLYHPAAALYNGGMRETLLDDFANIPIILKKLT
ncbi:MAG: uracil-DNA glycosylase [Candidatus Saccharibacteria bacterium]|nr:uracil-DNA glycosylase [Candidatus Saccharibacteria bacterium]